jgi:hypothetical protein
MTILALGGILCSPFAALLMPAISFVFAWVWHGFAYARPITIIPVVFYTIFAGMVVLIYLDPHDQHFLDWIIDNLFLIAATALIVAIALPFMPPKSSKQRFGVCRGCDYSLFGLDTPRCPECGSVITMDDIPMKPPTV